MYGVVGGGIAGLVAAARLREAGHAVRVFEPSEAVGGRARTHATAGDPIERIPHYVAGDAAPSLAAVTDLADRVAWKRGRTARYLDGTVHPVDATWERLAYPGTGLVDGVRLAAFARRARARLAELDGDPSGADEFAEATVEEFVRDRATRGVYEGYVEPALRARFGDRAGDVSAVWLAEWLRSRETRDRNGVSAGYVTGSMDGLVDALVATIGTDAIRTETRAVDLDRAAASGDAAPGEAVSVTVAGPDGSRTLAADGAVLATAPETLERLTGIDTGLETVSASAALVAADAPLTGAWRVTAADDAPFDRVVEHTNLCSAERYGGAHLWYVVDHGETTADAAGRDRLLDGLDACFASFSRDSVRWVRTAHDPAAAVVAPAGDAVPVSLADAGYPAVAYAGPGSRANRFGTSPSARVAAGIAAAESVLATESVAAADAAGGGRE